MSPSDSSPSAAPEDASSEPASAQPSPDSAPVNSPVVEEPPAPQGSEASPSASPNGPTPELDSPAPPAIASAEGQINAGAGVKARRPWLRRILFYGFLLILALLLALRLALPWIIPMALGKLGAMLELAISIERYELSLLAGDFSLRQLQVKPAEGGASYLELRCLDLEASPSDLLSGRLALDRLEIDGLSLYVDRDKQGQIEVLARILKALDSGAPPEPEPEEPESAESKPFQLPRDWSLPLLARQIALRDIRVLLRDESLGPPLQAALRLDLWASNLAIPSGTQATRFDLELSLRPFLESLRFSAQAHTSGRLLSASWQLELSKLDFEAARPYLAPLGIEVSKDLRWQLEARGLAELGLSLEKNDALALRLQAGRCRLQPAAGDGQLIDGLRLDDFELSLSTIDFSTIAIRRFALEGISARAQRTNTGAIAALGLRIKPPEKAAEEAPPKAAASAPAVEAPGADAGFKLPQISLSNLALHRIDLRFEDQAVTPPTALELLVPAVTVADLHIGALEQAHTLRINALIELPGVLERIEFNATAHPGLRRARFKGRAGASGLHLSALAPYLEGLGIRSTMSKAELSLEDLSGELVLGTERIEASVATGPGLWRDGATEIAGFDAFEASRLSLDLSQRRIELGSLRLKGARSSARLDAEGALFAAGLRIKPPPASPKVEDSSPEPAPPKPAPVKVEPEPEVNKPWQILVKRFALESWNASFEDARHPKVGRLGISDFNFGLTDLALVLAQTSSKSKAPIDISFGLPGLAKRLTIKGQLEPSLQAPALGLDIDAEGLSLERIESYLEGSPIRSTLRQGSLKLRLEAGANLSAETISAHAALPRFRFAESEQELLSFKDLRAGISLSPPADGKPLGLKVDELSLASLALNSHLQERRLFKVLGLALDIGPAADKGAELGARAGRAALEAKDPPPAPVGASPEAPLLADLPAIIVELPKVQLSNIALELFDEQSSRRHKVLISSSLGPLRWDSTSDAGLEGAPYKVDISASPVLDSLSLAGQLQLRGRRARVDLDLQGRRLNLRELNELLQPLNIEALMEKGDFGLALELAARLGPGIGLELALRDAYFKEGETSWLSLARLALQKIELEAGRISLGEVQIEAPLARVERRADGRLSFAGLALNPAPAPKNPAPPEPPLEPSTEGPLIPKIMAPALPKLALGGLVIRGAGLDWRDQALEQALALAPRIDLSIGALSLSEAALCEPAKLDLTLSVPSLIESARLEGSIAAASSALETRLNFKTQGFSLAALRPYIPPSIQSEIRDGRLRFDLELAAGLDGLGGARAKAAVTGFDWREAEAAQPWLAFEEASLALDKLDPEHVQLERLAFTGLRAYARKTLENEILASGLRIKPPAAGEPPAPGEAAAPTPAPPRRAGQRARSWPRLALTSLELSVAELEFTEERKDLTTPIAVRDLSFVNHGPIELLGADGEACAPLELRFNTSIAPIFSSLELSIDARPCARSPDIGLKLKVDGISGPGLNRLAAGRSGPITSFEMQDGALSGNLHVSLRGIERQNALDTSFLTRPFGVEFELADWSYEDRDRQRYLGLEALTLELASLDLESLATRINRLEIQGPFAWARNAKDGLRAAGLHIAPPPPKPAPSPPPPSREPAPPPDFKALLAGLPDLRLERFSINDVRIDVADRSFNPVFEAPIVIDEISALDPIAIRALEAGRSTRIKLRLHGDPVLLPQASKDLLGKLAGNLTDVVGFGLFDDEKKEEEKKTAETTKPKSEGEDAATLESRPFLGELRVDVEAALVPTLTTKIKVALEGLELATARGAAKDAGVSLNQGVLDANVRVELDKEGTLRLEPRLRFADLELSESSGGPIQSALGLSTPIDQVIFLLRDQDRVVTIPIELEIQKDKIQASEITRLIVVTLSELIARSIANVPGRVIGQVTDIVPKVPLPIPWLGTIEPPKLDPIPIVFELGSAIMDRDITPMLDPMIEAFQDFPGMVFEIEIELSGADEALLESRISPSAAQAAALLARSRVEIKRLEADRERLASSARAAFALGLANDAQDLWTQLRILQGEIGELLQTEAVLEEALSPRAERTKRRRLALAANDLFKRREMALRAAINARARSPLAPESVRVRRSKAKGQEQAGASLRLELGRR